MLSGQTRTIVLRLIEPATQGKIELMTPQPLVREMSQNGSIQVCGKG